MSAARDIIRDLSLAQGFDAVGFAPAELGATVSAGLQEFLAAGHHGDMGWLEARASVRYFPSICATSSFTVKSSQFPLAAEFA